MLGAIDEAVSSRFPEPRREDVAKFRAVPMMHGHDSCADHLLQEHPTCRPSLKLNSPRNVITAAGTPPPTNPAHLVLHVCPINIRTLQCDAGAEEG
jgi:hypothetical protein